LYFSFYFVTSIGHGLCEGWEGMMVGLRFYFCPLQHSF
jgi:hypothetical protein